MILQENSCLDELLLCLDTPQSHTSAALVNLVKGSSCFVCVGDRFSQASLVSWVQGYHVRYVFERCILHHATHYTSSIHHHLIIVHIILEKTQVSFSPLQERACDWFICKRHWCDRGAVELWATVFGTNILNLGLFSRWYGLFSHYINHHSSGCFFFCVSRKQIQVYGVRDMSWLLILFHVLSMFFNCFDYCKY